MHPINALRNRALALAETEVRRLLLRILWHRRNRHWGLSSCVCLCLLLFRIHKVSELRVGTAVCWMACAGCAHIIGVRGILAGAPTMLLHDGMP